MRKGNREYIIDAELNECYYGYVVFLYEEGKGPIVETYKLRDTAEERGYNWIHRIEMESQ